MPPAKTDPRHEAIRRTLAQRQGDRAGVGAIASATQDLWREVGADAMGRTASDAFALSQDLLEASR